MTDEKKQPFLPLFFGDFLASTAEWEGIERSLYLTILGYQWTLGSVPADPKKLAKLVDWERKLFEPAWEVVRGKFERRDGRLVNVRLEQHREKSQDLSRKNSAAGKKGAESRWRNGSDGTGDQMANANGSDSERHGAATDPPLAPANGITHGNPSHPIPSHDSKTAASGSTESPGGKRARRKSAQMPLPDDFSLDDVMRAQMLKRHPDCDVDQSFAQFCAYHRARDNTMANWRAAWTTWVGNAATFGYPKRSNGAHSGVVMR